MEQEKIELLLKEAVFWPKQMANGRVVECDPGQMLSDSPKGVPSLGIILSGQVDVYSVSIDGRDIQLNSLKEGDCFGICNLLEGSELETVLRCSKKTKLLYIPKEVIMEELENDPVLLRQYIRLCNKKIQFLLNRIGLLTMQSCRGKLLAFLLEEQVGESEIELSGSREELACRLGVSRAALFRELSLLQRQKVIRIRGNRIRILDVRRLEILLYQPMGA